MMPEAGIGSCAIAIQVIRLSRVLVQEVSLKNEGIISFNELSIGTADGRSGSGTSYGKFTLADSSSSSHEFYLLTEGLDDR